MLSILKKDISKLLLSLYPAQEQKSVIDALQLHPIDQKFGDFALNIGYLLAKSTDEKLVDINEKIKSELIKLKYVEKIEIVNGFVNVTLNVVFYRMLCEMIIDTGVDYGKKEMIRAKDSDSSDSKRGEGNFTVNFDFASMNPTGPMHAGHLSSAILSDTLCNILESQGYDVVREYYMNDTGGQIERLVKAVYIRYCELYGVKLDADKEYVGEYLVPIAEKIRKEHGDKWLNKSFEEYYETFREMSIGLLLQDIKEDLADLGIRHNSYFSEYEMQNSEAIKDAYKELVVKDLVKKQTLARPADWKGEYVSMDIEGLELGEQFRPLFKRDGSHTYLMGDIAYHIDRAKRCNWIIDCFGADHFEHANMLKEIVPMVSGGSSEMSSGSEMDVGAACRFDVKLCQMVKFHQDGQAVKFSKRTGTYVTARDIIEAIGKDALRIIMLTRKANAHFTVELNQLMQTDDNNPVFYIQYAYARCCSALNKGRAAMDVDNDGVNDNSGVGIEDVMVVNSQSMPDEFLSEFLVKKLLNKMLFWPQMLEQCVHSLEPHGLLVYMQEMAKVFHGIWYHGGSVPLLQLTREYKGQYPGMILCRLFKNVFGAGLKLLSVEARESMTKE